MFISYLERDKDDLTYITNRYPVGDLPKFASTGVLFNNGEEHRHNFKGYGEGYGHVMFLNIKKLVKPVSLGPGITERRLRRSPAAAGHRRRPQARRHRHLVPQHQRLRGRPQRPHRPLRRPQRLRRQPRRHLRGKLLPLPQHRPALPISTGTDWFMYDFSRVYAEVRGQADDRLLARRGQGRPLPGDQRPAPVAESGRQNDRRRRSI